MTRSLLILGCGGHGRVVADAALDCGYDKIAFLDDAHAALSGAGPFPVLGPISMMDNLMGDWPAAIAAIGNNVGRLQLLQNLHHLDFETPSVIHPSATISRNAIIGAGVFVAPGAVINTGATIGDATIVNTGACIDHDCAIGPGNHIAPGATLSGDVRTGERVWLGTGCSVKQGVSIGSDVVVGVGAAVVTDLSGAAVYVGVPAKPLTKST